MIIFAARITAIPHNGRPMKKIIHTIIASAIMLLSACSASSDKTTCTHPAIESLKDTLECITAKYPGEIGIALLTGSGDTITVNNDGAYPLMSVFKLHQAIALCNLFELRGTSLDSIVEIDPACLNPDTWSPMLKEHSGKRIVFPVRELLRYTLTQSDNNAINYMFEKMCSVAETDSFTATLIPRESFRLAATEAEMWADHARCRENHSSPLGAAVLIRRLLTDSTVCPTHRGFLCSALQECKTGADRIAAPLAGKDGVSVAHKTGSGFRSADGILSAHNDVAFVSLPDGSHYALAVLVKDFHGSETQAAQAIAEISSAVYAALAD